MTQVSGALRRTPRSDATTMSCHDSRARRAVSHPRAGGGLQDPRKDGRSAAWVVGEVLDVPTMVRDGAWDQVRRGEHREREPRDRPRGDRPADPLHELTEVVGTRDVGEQPGTRDLIAAATLAPQPTQLEVGPAVHEEATDEQHHAVDEAQVDEPAERVAGAELAQPARVEVGVQHVERGAGERDDDRYR